MISPHKIDLFNILLVIISLIIACILPFELFLYSYIILGPLHYLTEINWLQQKDFFIPNKNKWLLLFVVFIALVAAYFSFWTAKSEIQPFTARILTLVMKLPDVLLLMSFLFALGIIFLKKTKSLILELFIALIIATFLAFYAPKSVLYLGIFLPTVIHVYLFTLLFILYGALKSKSTYGKYLSLLLFLVPFIIFYIPIDIISYTPSGKTKEIFMKNNLSGIAQMIAKTFNKLENEPFSILSEIGVRIQIFIAFAYTYHYLNWFSKTSIIGWKKAITRQKSLWILLVWLGSIGLYFYDFKTGLYALFFLGYSHLILEFPLNALTIKGIFLFTKHKKKQRI